jgi:hypothetical protein
MRKYYIPFLLAAIIILAMFSSCISQKRRDKICLTCATKTTIKDTTIVKETIRYDTTYLTIQGPTEYLESPCDALCDSLGHLKPFYRVSVKNGIKQSLTSVGNVLVQKCDVDSLLNVNSVLTKEIDHLRSVVIEVPTCHKAHKTDNDIFWIKVGKWLFWILIGYVALRFLKIYLNTRFPMVAKWIP